MDKESNTWKEIMSMAKNNPKQMDDTSLLKNLGLDGDTLKKIEEDTIESAKEEIKVKDGFTC